MTSNKKLIIKTNGSLDMKFKTTGVVGVNNYNLTVENESFGFSHNDFEESLRKASQRISQPDTEKTETLVQ